MSADLQWLLLRKNNCFLVKRLVDGPIFTTEPGNLSNTHSYRRSGLIQPSIHVTANKDGALTVTTRKPSASVHSVKQATVVSKVRSRSGTRRTAGVVSAYPRKGYRPELSKLAVGRASALLASQKPKKPTPPRKKRGPKAKAVVPAKD